MSDCATPRERSIRTKPQIQAQFPDFRLPSLPPQELGSEQAALEVSLERARAIVAPRDAPYASDEDDDVLTNYQLGDVGRSVPAPTKYAFGTRPGPGLDTISPPKAKAVRGARGAVDGDAATGASASDPVFKEESLEEAFRRYDVDGSGFLDFGEASVALADMGALEGVLASKAGELFDRFDVDGDGQVDLDEFRELASKVRELRGSVNSKPAPEVPDGFAESGAALALRKSFAAFAAFGKGNRVGEAIEHVNGRDWSKLVKDCGLVGGSVNGPAADIIFARAVLKGQRVLRWEDGSFLTALAVVAAEHRVTFGQVAQRVRARRRRRRARRRGVGERPAPGGGRDEPSGAPVHLLAVRLLGFQRERARRIRGRGHQERFERVSERAGRATRAVGHRRVAASEPGDGALVRDARH